MSRVAYVHCGVLAGKQVTCLLGDYVVLVWQRTCAVPPPMMGCTTYSIVGMATRKHAGLLERSAFGQGAAHTAGVVALGCHLSDHVRYRGSGSIFCNEVLTKKEEKVVFAEN